MSGEKEGSEPLPALVELARRFPGALSSLKTVQTVMHALQAAEGESSEPGNESFVELLQPSPTVHEAMALAAEGGGNENDCGVGEAGQRSALLSMIRRLDELLGTVEVKSSLEGRLKEFEEEIRMPAEARGRLLKLVLSPDATLEGLVMFLATYFDAKSPEPITASKSPHRNQ